MAISVRRRQFIFMLGSAAAAWPLTVRAQPPASLHIGIVTIQSRTTPIYSAFDQRLRELGHIEGQNLVTDYLNPESQAEGVPGAIKELVRRKVDIIVAPYESTVKAAIAASDTVPVVMIATEYDPLALGYVKSLARPGGRVTGVFLQQIELASKRLQLMKDLLPSFAAATIFWDPLSEYQWKATSSAAASVFAVREFADAGGLLSYGPDFPAIFRRVAEYVDRIAKGAKAADLPVEQPTKFELVINVKTAKAIGLDVPDKLLALADAVIE
jgi:putative tryptophan/tyrosine transport system substrate-binding protein